MQQFPCNNNKLNAFKSILKKLGIKHRHLHERNFCIQMHEGKPKLYVIDFDLKNWIDDLVLGPKLTGILKRIFG